MKKVANAILHIVLATFFIAIQSIGLPGLLLPFFQHCSEETVEINLVN